MVGESLEERVRRVTSEAICVVEYDDGWPARFASELAHLRACLPDGIVIGIEHVGSTAVPGLAAKPIIDMLVEVVSCADVQDRVVPVLEAQRYEYFWRPLSGNDGPRYPWFIKRDPATGARTHHIHMMETGWAQLREWPVFRDYLVGHPAVAEEYAMLKQCLVRRFPRDRERYTTGKTPFIATVLARAASERS